MKLFTSSLARLGLLLSCWLGSAGSSFAQAPDWQWVESSSYTRDIFVYGPHQDRSGNLYIAGSFRDSIRFGTTLLQGVGLRDGFVAKLRPGGGWQWAQRINCLHSGTTVYVHAMSSAANGNTYVGGTFADSVQIGDTVLVNPVRNTAFFLAKFDSLGQVSWAIAGQNYSNGHSDVLAITTDSAGHVFVAGTFSWGLTLGATQLQSGSCFVARLSATGAYEWAAQTTGRGQCFTNSLVVDQTGNIYFSGFILGQVQFGTTTYTVPIGNTLNEAFIAKMNAAGTWQWAVRGYCGQANRRQSAISATRINRRGELYVVGLYQGATFGLGASPTIPNLSAATDSYDGFVARLDAGSGSIRWLHGFGSPSTDYGMALTLDSTGAPLIAGTFSQTCAFDSTLSVTAAGTSNPSDVFIGSLSTAGTWQWIVPARSQALSRFTGANPTGNLLFDNRGEISLGLTGSGSTQFGSLFLPPGPTNSQCVVVAHLAVPTTPTGVPTDKLTNFRVWPNPAAGHFYLSGAQSAEAELLDGVGRPVRRVSLPQGTGVVNVTGLPSGM